jgi:redox-sensitive bicupin YhaK (pirin superfamily)
VNNSPNKPLRLLQIWVFPEQHNIEPRYEQKAFDKQFRKNNWQLLAGPNAQHEEMVIKQQAWFSRIDLEKDKETTYDLYNKQSGIYLFVINGTVKFGGEQQLQRRDGAGIWEVDSLNILAGENSELLVIEVPMIE